MPAIVTSEHRDASTDKDWELGETRQQHAVDNPELEEAFENLYLDEEE